MKEERGDYHSFRFHSVPFGGAQGASLCRHVFSLFVSQLAASFITLVIATLKKRRMRGIAVRYERGGEGNASPPMLQLLTMRFFDSPMLISVFFLFNL